jgi:hypothetical protein
MDRVEGYTVVYRWDEDVILNFLDELADAGEPIPADVLHGERIAGTSARWSEGSCGGLRQASDEAAHLH